MERTCPSSKPKFPPSIKEARKAKQRQNREKVLLTAGIPFGQEAVYQRTPRFSPVLDNINE